MQVIWHENKIVQEVIPLVSVFKQFRHNDLSCFSHLKQESTLPSLRSNKVRPPLACVVSQPGHRPIPQGLKPNSSLP